jgi:hypothetical protein
MTRIAHALRYPEPFSSQLLERKRAQQNEYMLFAAIAHLPESYLKQNHDKEDPESYQK